MKNYAVLSVLCILLALSGACTPVPAMAAGSAPVATQGQAEPSEAAKAESAKVQKPAADAAQPVPPAIAARLADVDARLVTARSSEKAAVAAFEQGTGTRLAAENAALAALALQNYRDGVALFAIAKARVDPEEYAVVAGTAAAGQPVPYSIVRRTPAPAAKGK